MVGYYLVSIDSGRVIEIRRKIEFNSGTRYLIDKPKNPRYVDQEEFYNIPNGFKLVEIPNE